MSVQPLRQEAGRNPRTIEEAREFVKYVESLFMPWNIDALVEGFTDDCIVRFGTVPEFHGRAALRTFFKARSAKQKGYRLKKQFRTLMNDTMTNVWTGEWEDADSRVPMRGVGVEVWVMRDGKMAIWEAAFNVGRADQPPSVADLVRWPVPPIGLIARRNLIAVRRTIAEFATHCVQISQRHWLRQDVNVGVVKGRSCLGQTRRRSAQSRLRS